MLIKTSEELREEEIKKRTAQLSNVETGMSGELKVAYELSKHGFTPYIKLIDVAGIDLVVRNTILNKTYNEIQVKKSKKYEDGRYKFSVRKHSFIGRPYYYVIFVCDEDLFIIPSKSLGMYCIGYPKTRKKEDEKDKKWNLEIYEENGESYIICPNGKNARFKITEYKNNYSRLR